MMENDKHQAEAQVSDGENGNGYELRSRQLGGTNADEEEMRVLGRTQQLNRNFRFISTLGFACTLMSTWEIALM